MMASARKSLSRTDPKSLASILVVTDSKTGKGKYSLRNSTVRTSVWDVSQGNSPCFPISQMRWLFREVANRLAVTY